MYALHMVKKGINLFEKSPCIKIYVHRRLIMWKQIAKYYASASNAPNVYNITICVNTRVYIEVQNTCTGKAIHA